jgi:hypothetical protein
LEAPDRADESCYLGPSLATCRLKDFETVPVELDEFEDNVIVLNWIAVSFE